MKFFDAKLLKFAKGSKEVWYNLKSNKKKMLNVPHNTDPYYIIGTYLQSDDGIEMFKLLKSTLKKDR